MRFAIPIVWALTMAATRLVADPLPIVFAVAVITASIAAWRDRAAMRELFRVRTRTVILAAASAVAMVAVTYLAYPLLAHWFPSIEVETRALYSRFLLRNPLMLIIAAIIPVIVGEEVMWRGAFQKSTRRWSVLVTALVYAIAHVPAGSALLVAVAFACGLYWSALRAISGSLIPSLCAHLAWDIALIVFPLVLRSSHG